jgi:SgrR family transcriptional regulator
VIALKMAHHYIRLREHLPRHTAAEEVVITLDELADILDCTHRNVVLILKRMSALGWLVWSPKRGRGNKSTLTFLMRSEDMLLDIARDLVEKKDLLGALEYINRPSLPKLCREQFNEWLYGYFGYRAEVKDHKKIDLLRFPLSQPFYTLDPAFINYASESHLVNQLFDSLVRHRALTESIEPHLAHAWEVDSKRKIWTFFLRKGVMFHHGQEMNAEDVKFSLDRLRQTNTRSLYRWAHTQIKQIDAVDATTVRIVLHEPNALFLHFLSTSRAAIVPHNYGGVSAERFALAPNGTGPFKLINNNGTVCVLEAFQPYFQGRAHLDQVEIWTIPAMYDLKHNKSLESFQIIHNFRLPDHAEEATWNHVRRGEICKFITLNLLKAGPLKNAALRKALCSAIVRNIDINGHTASDTIYATNGFWDKADKTNEVDVKLAEAGYRGEVLELCTIPQYEADALIIQQACQLAGVELQIILLPLEQFQGERRLHSDIILFAVMLDNDAELRLIDLYKSMQLHVSPDIRLQMEQSIAMILQEPDLNNRRRQFIALERLLKAANAIQFLYRKELHTVYHPSVKGISLDSLGWVEFKNIWFRAPEIPTAYSRHS